MAPGLAAWLFRFAARAGVVAAVLVAMPARPAAAEELSARLACPPRPGPGRVVCEIELEVDSGALAWADVLVIGAPSFAAPLRSRVGPNALFMKTEQRWRLQLALAATRAGSGQLEVRARAMWCTHADQRACSPVVRAASASVQVGPITE